MEDVEEWISLDTCLIENGDSHTQNSQYHNYEYRNIQEKKIKELWK